MTTFTQKLNKLNKIQDAGTNYLMRRVSPMLTESFFSNYGDRYTAALNDIKENHEQEWSEYCATNKIWKNHTASDAFCL